MMGFKVKTKKEVKALIGKDVSSYFQETSLFGEEYKPTGSFCVCVSLDCTKVRNNFASLNVVDNILISVK